MPPISMPFSRFILLAEDDVMVRNLVRSFLQRQAFNVLAASDGSEALELSHAHLGTIDLFLTDVEMPVMNGISAYRHICEQRPGTKVLFMSGGTSQLELPEQWPFLSKPFDMNSLLIQIEDILADRMIGREASPVHWPIHRP